MTAFTILIHELARHGQVTYAQLLRRHPSWRFGNFAAAVYKARKRGIVKKERGRGTPIVVCGECPCCGRPLAK